MSTTKNNIRKFGTIAIPDKTKDRIKNLASYGDYKEISELCGVDEKRISEVIARGRGSRVVVRSIVEFYKEKEREVSELAG